VHLPTPHLDAVLDEHGPYADESAVYRAALADGYGPLGAEAYLAEWVAARDREFALEQAAELAAERALSEWPRATASTPRPRTICAATRRCGRTATAPGPSPVQSP
jgi:hypothetical protein